MARCLAVTLVSLISLSVPAYAEWRPGFTLLGTGGDAPKIVEVHVDDRGQATAVRMIRGGGTLETIQDPRGSLAIARPGADRAILFLSRDGAIEDPSGVAWIDRERVVHPLPDNWGWGFTYPLEYRRPTVDEFLKSLGTAARDRSEVDRISSLTAGPERARAMIRLLSVERPENSWYVSEGPSFASHLKLPMTKWSMFTEVRTYREELSLALSVAVTSWSPDEKTLLREEIGKLGPGEVRRECVRLLIEQGVGRGDSDLLAQCHDEASTPRERALAAQALVLAHPDRGFSVVLGDLVPERHEAARRLLPLLGGYQGEVRDRFLDAVDRLVDSLVAAGEADGNLGFALCGALKAGGRKCDLAGLLTLSRSSLSCARQALVELQDATQQRWTADDPSWDALVR